MMQPIIYRSTFVLFSLINLINRCQSQSIPDYRCTRSTECQSKYPRMRMVCCAQISCNDAYKYYRFTSGCAKADHCKPEYRINRDNGQFSARLIFEPWSAIVQRLGADFNKCRQVQRLASSQIDRMPTDDVAITAFDSSIQTVSSPAFRPRPPREQYCDDQKQRECESQRRFCCTRVTCSTGRRSRVPYKLDDVCVLPGGCANRKQTSRTSRQLLMWFEPSVWRQRQTEFRTSKFHNKNLPVIGSCVETLTFLNWLKLNP